jgi:hypothetical protein
MVSPAPTLKASSLGLATERTNPSPAAPRGDMRSTDDIHLGNSASSLASGRLRHFTTANPSNATPRRNPQNGRRKGRAGLKGEYLGQKRRRGGDQRHTYESPETVSQAPGPA